MSLFDLENSALGDWGIRRGTSGKQFPGSRISMGAALTIPREPNLYGGLLNNSSGTGTLCGATSAWG